MIRGVVHRLNCTVRVSCSTVQYSATSLEEWGASCCPNPTLYGITAILPKLEQTTTFFYPVLVLYYAVVIHGSSDVRG